MDALPMPVLVAAVVVLVMIAFALRPKGSSSEKAAEKSTSNGGEAQKEAAPAAPAFPAGELVIFFGSQTGTAEGFAQTLASEGKKHGFDARASDLEDFEESEMSETTRALFMMATYGEGEPTDNAAPFMKWVQNGDGELTADTLSGMQFAVFGLGNTQYEHYNMVGKSTDESLEKLGAKRIFKLGLGDDDNALDDDFEQWREELWPELLRLFNPNAAAEEPTADPDEVPDVAYDVVVVKDDGQGPRERAFSTNEVNGSTKHYFSAVDAKVLVNRELRTTKDPGSTRHIELDIRDTGVDYQTADNAAVLPENDDASVAQLAKALGYDLDMVFRLEPKESGKKHLFPTPCSVRVALKSFCDIHGIPRRATLKDLLPFVKDAAHRESLAALSAKEGRQLYKDTIEEQGRSLLDVIVTMYPSFQIPLAHFMTMVPRLQPRYYTISSSSTVHPTRIHLTVSVIEQAKADSSIFHGVCSTFLQNLEPPVTEGGKRTDEGANGAKRDAWPSCRIFVRDSSFRLPADPSTPILLIGPGTGIAPMRALLQERDAQRQQGLDVGASILYFGCKKRDVDFLYEDELEGFRQSGALTTLHLAFSRETKEKVYVQHVMARPDNAKEIWELVEEKGAYIYVCGGTGMGSDVGKVLHGIVKGLGGMDAAKATSYVDKMKAEGRYVQELWA